MANQVTHINQLSHIESELLKNAEFIQHGKTLFVKLPNEKLLVVKDYFENAPDTSKSNQTPGAIQSGDALSTTNALGIPGELIYNPQAHNPDDSSDAYSIVELNSFGIPRELLNNTEISTDLYDDSLFSNNARAAALLLDYTTDNLIFMDASAFKELVLTEGLTDLLSEPDSLITAELETAIAATVSGDSNTSELSLFDTELLAEILNISDDLQSFKDEQTLASSHSVSAPRAVFSSDGINGAFGSDSAHLFAPPADASAGELATVPGPPPPVVAPVALGRLADSLGTLNANLDSLDSANIEQGSLLPTKDVDGINGLGGNTGGLGSLGSGFSSDGISGALGSDSPQSLAPPADAFAGAPVLPEIPPHTINFDGLLNLSYKDIQWDALTHLNDANITAGDTFGDDKGRIAFEATSAGTPLTGDLLVFSDAGDFLHSYTQFGLSTSGGSSVTFSYAKLSGFTDINAATTFTLNYTLGGAQSINVDVTAATTGQQVVDLINAHLGVTALANDATLNGANAFDRSADGFKAVWDGESIGIANYDNVSITSASLAGAGGSSTIDSYSAFSSLFTFDGNGFENLPGGDVNYFSPGHLHAAEYYIIYNTNLSRYTITGASFEDEQFAVSGANNPDFVSINTGEFDVDTLSFYVPAGDTSLPGDPNNATDPTGFGDGDGDYDLVTQNAYTKIDNIEILEARNYGTNDIVLSQTALKSAAEEMKWVDLDGNGVIDPLSELFIATHSQHWTISIAGDAADTVTLSDENTWHYNGIVDITALTVHNWINDGGTWKTITQYNIDNDPDSPIPPTINIDSTRDAYGNILYQYKASNAGDTYYLNVSTDILDHPDWYYSGTAGNDALELPDTQFGSVDFAAGTDTLELFSGLASKTQDFTGEGGDLANVEIINFANTYKTTAGGADFVSVDTITLDKTFITAATDDGNTLSLIGDNADSVTVSDIQSHWNYMGQITGSGGLSAYSFKQYKAEDGTTLNIELEMTDGIGTYYNGFAGDFAITPVSSSYDGIEGGTGTDSLGFNTALQNFTDGSFNINTINDIEVLEGNTHAGATSFTVNETVVDSITEANTLTILGDSGVDNVLLTDTASWSFAGIVPGQSPSGDPLSLYQYRRTEKTDDSTLNVQSNLATTPDVFFNPGLNSGVDNVDDKFIAPDLNFISLNGGNGIDWLRNSNDDYDFTSAGVATKINELEIIDSREDSNNNTVTLDLASVTAMTNAQNTMTVIGDANDGVSIADLASNPGSSWSYIGHVGGIHDFIGLEFHQYLSTNGASTINIWDGIANQPDIVIIGDIAGTGISNNLFHLEHTQYSYIDGLTGTDTVQMISPGSFDFSTLGSKTANIEALSIAGDASDLTVSANFVNEASSNNGVYENTVFALGDSGDTVSFSDNANWSYTGYTESTSPGDSWHLYRGNDAGSTVWFYTDTDFGQPIVDALGTDANDSFQFKDKEDANIDGGSGFDTLSLLASLGTNDVDLTTGKNVANIELINIDNGSKENVTFNLATVDSTSNNSMYVIGDSGLDSVNAAPGEQWVLNGRETYTDAPDMYLYQNNNASLYVQTDLLQSLFESPTGTSGDDILTTLQSTFGSINGQSGFDRLQFVQEGSIDITSSNNTLTSIEVLDVDNNLANSVTLDIASVLQMSSENTAYVLGDTSDSLQLQGGWQQGQSFAVSGDLTLNSYTSFVDGQSVNVFSDSQVNTSIA